MKKLDQDRRDFLKRAGTAAAAAPAAALLLSARAQAQVPPDDFLSGAVRPIDDVFDDNTPTPP